ncbi:malto-oligosyltrehalose synthase [Agrobacterium larrymoorei]|uniref:Malto-oligosyltrehalose synthase n=1 Tax=Agrobacterium larrymoorei TaxID=160699 RepID=A0AAF0HAF6_9HYPH|nr:malto-oligosyltrehalose synthase [Agrobacterium larrymoorei]WHA43429.1 malto-oligosyltrehalose synthase [Agrobacterium larrymoorei]
MTFPTATYRIQFRNGMTFDRAAKLVPYLKALGISHFYASPIFTATSGSTHGYDVTDANEIDPAIGGREGFDGLVAALKQAGLGLILDIVPNHMAASLETPWWRDVVEHGEKSRYARHFDIDWSRKLTLPFLGDSFEKVLADADISIAPDPNTGKPAFAYFESFYLLNPETYEGREAEVLKTKDPAVIQQLHDQQSYRLTSWREAASSLSYRRFFEVSGLAGVRVEDETVFRDSHRLILELVRNGSVQGLRIDHIDGLADPKGYVDRLRREAGPDCYITVEKILGEGEQLPADWPVSGTTGYEFIASLSHALVDDNRLGTLRSAYEKLCGEELDVKQQLRDAKLMMVSKNFEGEVSTLLKLASTIGAECGNELSEPDVKDALREMLIAFPVYRTYGTAQGLRNEDKNLLDSVLKTIKSGNHVPSHEALEFLSRILNGDVPSEALELAAIFRTKFQQLTGPMMAKSIEDTLFYRQNMLLGINEVGAEPVPPRFSLDRFHEDMQLRAKLQPMALSGTSTHDTKRGEDARARLYTLSEAPEAWADAVERWRQMNAKFVCELKDGAAPEPEIEWMLYQALAGLLLPDFEVNDQQALGEYKDRFLAYVEKALREAKLRTNWGDSNEDYEQAVKDYAEHLLSPENSAFLEDFLKTLRPFIDAGLADGITQTIIKLLAPGVPDIYQGSEALDFSLVDPDNRREPDFEMLAKWLSASDKPNTADISAWHNGSLKQQVIMLLLKLRQQSAKLFQQGEYVPLQAAQDNTIAFARVHDEEAVLVVLPRFTLEGKANFTLPPKLAEAGLPLPSSLANRNYRNVLTDEQIKVGHEITGDTLADQSFLILHAKSA